MHWHADRFLSDCHDNLFCRGSQLSTRQAYNYIDALIKDPERDVTEILPVRSRKYDLSSSTVTHKHSSLINSPNLSSSISKTSSAQQNHLKSSPPSAAHQLSYQQPQYKHTAPVTVSPVAKPITKTSLAQNAAPQSRPLKIGGTNTASSTTTTTTTTIVKVESTGWASTTTSTTTTTPNLNNFQVKRNQAPSTHQNIPVTVIKSTVSSKVSSSKPLPKPIGSNRPVKSHVNKESTQTTQSTRTAPSVSSQHVSTTHVSTTHSISQRSSALNSFFSQVATQARSPMIWNDPEVFNEGSDVIVTSAISHSTTTTTSQCFIPTSVMTHNTSPTPSLSPTPSNSASPSPSGTNEERPHLNPIGTERAHKRCSTGNVPSVPRMPAFQPSMHFKLIYISRLFVQSGSKRSEWVDFMFSCSI